MILEYSDSYARIIKNFIKSNYIDIEKSLNSISSKGLNQSDMERILKFTIGLSTKVAIQNIIDGLNKYNENKLKMKLQHTKFLLKNYNQIHEVSKKIKKKSLKKTICY